MDAIGGYFELELRNGSHYHEGALKLNTARNCLEYLLKVRRISKLYIPYYTCDVILEPLNKCGVKYEFYNINESFEPSNEYSLKRTEAFLYTNYFGLKQKCVDKLAGLYGKQLIVDNAQAFYSYPLDGIDTFYSPRKFFGVADGGYLYKNTILNLEFSVGHSYNRISHLIKRIDVSAEFGYNHYKENEDALINQPIMRMSALTEKLLGSLNYGCIRSKRKKNFQYLQNELGNLNFLVFDILDDEVPMVYPFISLKEKSAILRRRLIENRVFVAQYWPNVLRWLNKGLEVNFANNLLPLPIDQRYSSEHMNKIIDLLMV